MQGDTSKARTQYQDFLTLWKDDLAAKGPATPATPNAAQNHANVALAQNTPAALQPPSGPKFRGKIPVHELIH